MKDTFLKITFIIFCLLLPGFLFAQNQPLQKGKILDAANRQPLSFVNIAVKGTSYGTVSDIDGNFVIKNIKIPAELQFSYVGYENKSKSLTQVSNEPLVIYLKPKTIDLPELTVNPGDNPAHRIIRKVIENRPYNNPEQLASFKYVSYNKLVFTIDRKSTFYRKDSIRIKPEKATRYKPYPVIDKNDSNSVVAPLSSSVDSFFNKNYLFLSESVTRRLFMSPDKNKETVIATRTSGIQQPYFIMMATQFQSFSFYSDMVNVFDKKYLNPLSKQAIGHYFYEIKDTTFSEEGDTVFVIFFRPLKKTLFDGLKGTMQINTNGYAVQTINAEPAKQDGSMYVNIQQLYKRVDNKQWFPYQLNTQIKMSGIQVGDKNDTLLLNDTTAMVIHKTLPLIGIGKSYIDSVEINPDLEKRTFNSVQVELAKDANKKDDSLWMKYRAETFGEVEKNTYKTIDSIGKKFHLDNKIRFMEYLLGGYIPVGIINVNIKTMFAYNRYEGLRTTLDVITNEKISRYWAVGGYLGYGFLDGQYKYGGSFQIIPKPVSDTRFTVAYKNDVRETGEINFYESTSITGSESYRKLYISAMDKVEQYQAGVTFRLFSYFKNNVRFERTNMIFNPPYAYTMNETSFTSVQYDEYTFSTKFLYKEQFFQTLKNRFSLGSKYPAAYFNIHYGTFAASNESYLKMEAKTQIPIRWGINGKTTLTLMGGYTPDRLPLSLLYSGYSSFYSGFPISAENTFATMHMGEFYFSSFAFAFLKHDFGKVLFHFGKFNPGLSLHQNFGIGDLLHAGDYSVRAATKPYLEAGFQLYNLFKQSFEGLGIGAFYRYGYYSSPYFKNNLAIKLVLTIQLD